MEKFQICIKSREDYGTKKEFNLQIEMTAGDFLNLCEKVIDHLDENEIAYEPRTVV